MSATLRKVLSPQRLRIDRNQSIMINSESLIKGILFNFDSLSCEPSVFEIFILVE